jgi:hypothetical protein
MKESSFDEGAFFKAALASGARALLIGRRALVLLGLPVLTADYGFWIALDDIHTFNAAAAAFELNPTHTPEESRQRGRYLLENDEHIDVLVARAVSTVGGALVEFEDVWSRRVAVSVAGVDVWLPSLDDLILMKQFGSRPRDLADIRLLRILKEQRR